MKVLHLIQRSQLRGAEIFASQLASHTHNAGSQAVLVAVFPGESKLPHNGEVLSLNGIPQRRFFDIKAWKKLSSIIAKERPDIIQANAGDTLKYAVFSKLMYRWKQPIIFRNASTISLYIKSRFAKKMHGFFFRYADKIVSVSDTSAADFTALYPEFQKKVIVIPVGVEDKMVLDERSKAVNSIGQGMEKGPLIIHVGGFTFEKNHTGVIDIFELILEKKPTATLYLVGDGPLRQQTEKLVRAKGLDSQIKFLGFRTNALQLMRGADVLILPSIIEGLPGVILEAFFCKVPVVAYDVGGIKEILKNHQTGRLIPGGDKHAFASAVLDATHNTPQNIKLVENAYDLVTSNYLNTQIARRFATVYESLI